MSNIRTRFAPSPTGYLHVGGLRSALYNYLFARKHGGRFILRIEDTDQKRYVKGALENLIISLEWANLDYDEGVYLKKGKIAQKGNFGPYIQSQRIHIYQKFAKQLVDEGKAYYCFCQPDRLEKMRREQSALKKPPMYDKFCLYNLSSEEINKKMQENCPFTIRLNVEKGREVVWNDLIKGRITFNSNLIDDQIILKSDGYPTYHLANVVDDHLMKISHVIRGEEWLSSTPKHILLYEAFGWQAPQFAHLPLILNADRKKLSKREGDVSVEDYMQKGYLSQALINFVALLGWNPGKGETKEIFSMRELIEKFDINQINKAGAIFDTRKLDWINSQYIRKMPLTELLRKTHEFLKNKDFYKKTDKYKRSKNYLKKFLTIEKERLVILASVGDSHKFFFLKPHYQKDLLRWKEMSDQEVLQKLKQAAKVLSVIDSKKWQRKFLESVLLKEAGEKRGEFLWPLRAALTGEEKSPPPHEVAWVLGKKECIDRIKKAIRMLEVK